MCKLSAATKKYLAGSFLDFVFEISASSRFNRFAGQCSQSSCCRPCSQMDELPHSTLHWLRRRPCCSQMDEPPHSLHTCRVRCRPCSQNNKSPHSLHRLRRRSCSQMDAPPHSLHWLRRRPCSQMDEPPHSLHPGYAAARARR